MNPAQAAIDALPALDPTVGIVVVICGAFLYLSNQQMKAFKAFSSEMSKGLHQLTKQIIRLATVVDSRGRDD